MTEKESTMVSEVWHFVIREIVAGIPGAYHVSSHSVQSFTSHSNTVRSPPYNVIALDPMRMHKVKTQLITYSITRLMCLISSCGGEISLIEKGGQAAR